MEPEPRINLRPTNSTPSFRGANNRPDSIHSTVSTGRSRRHGLLRLLNSVATVEQPKKDLPAPPVLTPAPSEPADNIGASYFGPNISTSATNHIGHVHTAQNEEASTAADAEESEVDIEPIIQAMEAQDKTQPGGLDDDTVIGDAVIAVKQGSPIRTSPSTPSSVEIARYTSTKLANSDRSLGNRKSAIKVRPAIGLVHIDERHEGHPGAHKVRAASDEASGREVVYHSGIFDRMSSKPEQPYSSEHLHSGHSLTPRVQTFIKGSPLQEPRNDTNPDDIHEGHISVRKVRPYHDMSATLFKESNLMPRLAMGKLTEEKKPSTASSYWGFLPRFGQKEHDDAGATSEPKDDLRTQTNRKTSHSSSSKSKDKSVILSRGGKHPSVSASHYSSTSQKSFEAVSKASAKIASNQENIRHDNESAVSFGKLFDSSQSQRETALQELEKGANVSPSGKSSTSDQRRLRRDPAQLDQGSLSERVDVRRASAWLRQLLGYPEPSDTKLTQLPEKSHPRHEEHEDYPSVASSRVTTFSRQNAADAGAMESAIDHLERLLNEALVLADQVTGQGRDRHGHIDNDDLQSCLRNISEIYGSSNQGSVRKSIAARSNEDVHVSMLAGTPPTVFVGPGETVGKNLDVLPLPSAKPQWLTRPVVRNGNVRRHHVSDDDCVLPMPPPDKKLKRYGLTSIAQAYDEDDPLGVIKPRTKDVPNSREVREYIRVFHQPPITHRQSSRDLWKASQETDIQPGQKGMPGNVVDIPAQHNYSGRHRIALPGFKWLPSGRNQSTSTSKEVDTPRQRTLSKLGHGVRNISLRKRSHVSIRDEQRFSLTRYVKRQPIIARDWSPARKRFAASVACISTALIGILIGIYAGLVPSIQYYIADFHHYSILGNVFLYLGMALPTFFCWPLPLLHGRKPYILCSLCVAMPLLFPQAVAVSVPRSPYTRLWRWALLLSRAAMGCALGFASMNFHSILTDLFGASLMSRNPHQEVADRHDVRRHGGGLGIWLGVWTWCYIGSLGIGFLVGALVIDTLPPSWGLYISIILIAVVLLLNVVCPEVRRSAWRYSVAEVKMGSEVSRRVGRGEIMMHRVKDGPKWWGQEMYHGVALSLEMLRQPGFVIMAVYSAWIYAQVVLIIVLLGSLTSKHYHFRSPFVGAAVSSVAVGALAAVPFQMANIFSRSRSTGPVTNSMTFDRKVTWTSHLVRRAIFVIVLPIAGIFYTIVSSGPPVHLVFPCLFAAAIGFLSCLAIAECNGILMEAWDCSDMQPGMTGRSKSGTDGGKCTNYSSFPRVTAGWNTIHSIGFVFAAGATGIGGIATRSLGQRAATGIVASILFMLSVLLLAVFARFRRLQIIPNSKSMEMDRWTEERRDSLRRRASAIAAAKASGLKDVSEIQLGSLTRWSEIRKSNRLIDEGVHLNRQTVDLARDELGRRRNEFIDDISGIVRKVSKRSARSRRSHDSEHEDRVELEDIGPLSHHGGGFEHQHSTLPRDVYLERECVMGQTVPEEVEELSSMDGGSDDDYGNNQSQGHSSHMISKVQPYTGFERRRLGGARRSSGDYVIDMDASHLEPDAISADPYTVEHRTQHGAHMKNKVRPADLGSGSSLQEHDARVLEGQAKPGNTDFEEVDLGGRSERKDSKTTKQD
ncbi:hypothetical protein GGR52DRAFT_585659 [Hypoxylon sp. FL1284]|nr:hypothetical protein GGR52DRAFT_585659 [Hypoxylon sp. FL1284]